MPGTRARRAREYRAWARSLELIGQPPAPADCFKHRLVDLVYFVYLVHLVSFVQPKNQTARQTRATSPFSHLTRHGLLELADIGHDRSGNLRQRQYLVHPAELDRLLRHTEDHATGFVLGDRIRTGLFHGQHSLRAIAAHSR